MQRKLRYRNLFCLYLFLDYSLKIMSADILGTA